MKKILANLAMIENLKFCKQNGIDCSGTHLYKMPRKYHYYLVSNETGKALVVTIFRKNAVPSTWVIDRALTV